MDIRRAFVLSSYILVLTGILSLALAEGTPATIAIPGVLSVLAYVQAEVRARPLGRLATNLLVFAALAAAPLDHIMLSGDAILALAHFLIAVQIVKLFGVKAARDYMQLFLISLMHLGVAAILTVDLVFSVAFFVYMMIATWTLTLFTLVRELDSRGVPAEQASSLRVGRGVVAGAVLVSGGTLVMTAAFFLAFPRFSAILFQVQRRSLAPHVSGFSDELKLTDLSAIKENQDDVMHVLIDKAGDRFPNPPKWRGLAFDRYEDGLWKRSWQQGSAWKQSPVTRVFTDTGTRGTATWTFMRPDEGVAGAGEVSSCKILLSPTGTDALFAVPRATSVEFLSPAQPNAVAVDPGDSLRAPALPPTEVLYRVECVPVPRWAARGADVEASGKIDGVYYLARPRGPLDLRRIESLAADVVARAGARTPLEKAQALEDHLKSSYAYTLDLTPAPPGVDPIDDFLFTKKEGHCELFASAFVIMARSQGLPARLVNGFQSGEWNELGSYYLVRQSDAHAWAEVHFAGVGWVDFDPTPGGGSPRPTGVFAAWRRFRDYMKLRWLSYVISYNLGDQLSFADRVRQRLGGVRETVTRFFADMKRWLEPDSDTIARSYALFSVASGLGLVAVIVWRRRGAKRKAGAPARRRPTVAFYEELLRALDGRGWRRAPTETPREFAARVIREGGEPLRPAALVVESFYAVRFGNRPLAAADETAVRGALAAIQAP